jgi:hypothetical protein
MFVVPDPSFVLKDTVGEMYFCNFGAHDLRRTCAKPCRKCSIQPSGIFDLSPRVC